MSSPHFDRFAEAATQRLGEDASKRAVAWLRDLGPDARFEADVLGMEVDADDGNALLDFQGLIANARDAFGFLVEVARIECTDCRALVDRADVLADEENACPRCRLRIHDVEEQKPQLRYRLHPDAEAEAAAWQAAQKLIPQDTTPGITVVTDNRTFHIENASGSHFGTGDVTNNQISVGRDSDPEAVLAAVAALVRGGVRGGWHDEPVQALGELIENRSDIDQAAIEKVTADEVRGADESSLVKFRNAVATSTVGGLLVKGIGAAIGI